MNTLLFYKDSHPTFFKGAAKFIYKAVGKVEYNSFTNQHPYIQSYYLLQFLYLQGLNPIRYWKDSDSLGIKENPAKTIESMIFNGATKYEELKTNDSWE